MKNWSKLLLYSGIVASILVFIFLFFIFYSGPKEPYSVNVIFMKLNILQGGENERYIQIKNNENQVKDIRIRLEGLEGMASLDDNRILLSGLEKKDVRIIFKANGNDLGIYFGNLVLECASGTKKIPIILGVEEPDRIFAIAQTGIPKYENVYPGGKFGVEIKTFDLLGTDLRQVRIEYQIKNSDDKIVFSEQEDSAIKGTFETTKIVDIPENFEKGNYVFTTSIVSGEHRSFAGYLFEVSGKEETTSSGEWSFGNYFFWFVLGFIFVILALFFYFVKSGDDIIAQLQKQHTSEIKYYCRNIDNQRKKSLASARNKNEREKLLKEFKTAKDKVVKAIRVEQKKQLGEANNLKINKNRKLVNKKLYDWRKRIYSRAMKAAQESHKLNIGLGALEKAYSEGYITRESYDKGRSRINVASKKLKGKSL